MKLKDGKANGVLRWGVDSWRQTPVLRPGAVPAFPALRSTRISSDLCFLPLGFAHCESAMQNTHGRWGGWSGLEGWGGGLGRGGPGCVPGPSAAHSGQPAMCEEEAPRVYAFTRWSPAWGLPSVIFPICSFPFTSPPRACRLSRGERVLCLLGSLQTEELPAWRTLGGEMTPGDSLNSRKEWNMDSLKVSERSSLEDGWGDSKCVLGGDFWVLVNYFHVFAWFLVYSGVLIHESVSICMFVQEIIRFMEMVRGLSLESYSLPISLVSGAIYLASAPVCLCFLFTQFVLSEVCLFYWSF